MQERRHKKSHARKEKRMNREQETDILKKIRDEIMKLQTYKMFEGEKTVYIERNDVLKIIDGHKTESEAEDAHSN